MQFYFFETVKKPARFRHVDMRDGSSECSRNVEVVSGRQES